jgi:hypothetical protein
LQQLLVHFVNVLAHVSCMLANNSVVDKHGHLDCITCYDVDQHDAQLVLIVDIYGGVQSSSVRRAACMHGR